jgi:hypothetical protein
MHNSLHPSWAKEVLLATEEVTVTDCAKSGRFATYDLSDSYGGAGFRSTKENPYRLKVLDTWTPEKQAGSTGCDSAHYFTDRGDGITANAFYTQGTRFLDVRNPRDIRQVGYWLPPNAVTWAATWITRDLVYTADVGRGLDVLRVTRTKAGSAPSVVAPIRASWLGAAPRSELMASTQTWKWVCSTVEMAAMHP